MSKASIIALMNKGTIALDIDGTITNQKDQIPNGVVTYFENLYKQGWRLLFITGRAFSFAMTALSKLPFPYLLAVQNGADLIEMPSMKNVDRAYLKIDVVELLDQLYKGLEGDFIVYSGYEKGDFCYFRPERFSKKMQDYLGELEKLSASPWKRLESFEIKEQSAFPLIKCIGSKEMLEGFHEKLLEVKGIKTSMIKDPISREFYLILVTHQEADKGIAAHKFMEKYLLDRPLITAGDDNNDIPLLKAGDIRIAMDKAPSPLQKIAHIIAPPADRMGIIQGIQEAIAQ